MPRILSTDPEGAPAKRIMMLNVNWGTNYARTATTLKELGVTDVSCFLNTESPAGNWAPNIRMTGKLGSYRKAVAWCKAMADLGFGVHPLIWTYKPEIFHQQAAVEMRTFFSELDQAGVKVRSLIFDAEGAYFKSSADAGNVLRTMDTHWAWLPVPASVSGLPGKMENQGEAVALVQWCTSPEATSGAGRKAELGGLGMPQVYSKLVVGGAGEQLPQRWTTPDKIGKFGITNWMRVAPASRIAPIVDAFGDEYPGWADNTYNAMAAQLDSTAKALAAVNPGRPVMLGIWSYGNLFDVGSDRALGSARAADRIRAIKVFKDNFDVQYRSVPFQEYKRSDLSAGKGNQQAAERGTRARSAPRYDVGRAVSQHRMDTGYPTGGLTYDFKNRRWV